MPSLPTESMLSATESYYGLSAPPFSLTPDPRFVYHSRSHSRALEDVRQALRRREGLIVVTGDIGVGKTVLCRTLLEEFEPRTFLSVVLDPKLGVEDLLCQVLVDFGLMSAAEPGRRGPIDRHQLVTTLQRFLETLIPLDAHAVIMIDEAQHLDPAVLEEIRLLSNVETDDAKLLQIVLVGQTDLEEVLKRRDLRQLSQRITRRLELQPLSPREVQQYIDHRLRVAAGQPDALADSIFGAEDANSTVDRGVRFAPSAIAAITTISNGLPRVINVLCQRALEIGCERDRRTIDRGIVLAAARALHMPGPVTRFDTRVAVALSAIVLLALSAAAWWWLGSPASQTTTPAAVAPVAATPPAVPQAESTPPPPVATPSPVPSVAATSPVPVDATQAPPPSTPVQAPADAPLSPRYTIAVASFRTPERATEVAGQVEALGLPVTTRFDAASGWHQILVGPYTASLDALGAQELLTTHGFAGTRISASSGAGPSNEGVR